jgi:hypothetical protein
MMEATPDETPEMTTFLDQPCGQCGRTWRSEGAAGNKRDSAYSRARWHEMRYGHTFIAPNVNVYALAASHAALVAALEGMLALNREKGSPLGDYGTVADAETALDAARNLEGTK